MNKSFHLNMFGAEELKDLSDAEDVKVEHSFLHACSCYSELQLFKSCTSQLLVIFYYLNQSLVIVICTVLVFLLLLCSQI